MSVDDIELFKKCFKNISVSELNKRIHNYRKRVDLKNISEEDLNHELSNLFKVKLEGKELTFFVKSDTLTKANQPCRFYRIRKFTKQDDSRLQNGRFESMQKEQDIWSPPDTAVSTIGRLNRLKEGVFYAASQATNSIYETGCQQGTMFFLMIYQSKKQMRLSQIHVNAYLTEFDRLENEKQAILHKFLFGEFTKVVKPGEEYNYKSTLAIYRQFFYNPDLDGFTYPSIKTNLNIGFNICFSAAKAKENLQFCGLMVCRLGPPCRDSEFQLTPIYDGFLNDSGSFDFHPYNSAISREKFGDFALIRDFGL